MSAAARPRETPTQSYHAGEEHADDVGRTGAPLASNLIPVLAHLCVRARRPAHHLVDAGDPAVDDRDHVRVPHKHRRGVACSTHGLGPRALR